MSRWITECTSFGNVRNMMQYAETATDCIEILNELVSCCDEILSNTDVYWDFHDDFIGIKSEINDEIELMSEDDDYNDCEETVNYCLNEFYNLCDVAKVWCAM